jgi:probable HAF family extracellular repeat protein
MFPRVLVTLLAILVISASSLPTAQSPYRFNSLDVPFQGAFNTTPQAIVRPGQFLGRYEVDNFSPRGFTYANGQFAVFNVPGASAAVPLAANFRGDVVGSYYDARGRPWGFLYRNGVLTTLDMPSTDPDVVTTVQPLGINTSGDVVGNVVSSNQALDHGFLYSDGAFSRIEVPAARLTIPSDINDRGVIVGWYQDFALRPHAFIYADGEFTVFDVPGAWGTLFNAINNRNQIVGLYYSPVRVGHGLFYADGLLTSLDVPGASFTQAEDIDEAGTVIGNYLIGDRDVDFKSWRGFVATPVR